MSSLNLLYQDIILDHHQAPRNYGEIESPQMKAVGFNPMCGDRVCVQLNVGAKGLEPRFHGEGCSICMASASMMAEEVEGMSPEVAKSKVEEIRALMQGEIEEIDGDLNALAGVRRFPVRIKCALLPWTTLKEALDGKS